ncbi:MAG TPA: hypothetical protein VLE99_04320 [Candidatus Saccharimonadales bacterium]|nr:hypothetical protein [Candidatus Saccharimonadales bacterium]
MSNKILTGVIVLLVVACGAVFVLSQHTPSSPSVNTSASLSSLNTGPAPWPAESAHLQNRLKAINIPLLGEEGTATHTHTHLDVYIHGQKTAVPAEIGILSNGISPVHTHDASGVIHVESPDANASYTLGQFFNIWGVRFTGSSIGGYMADGTNMLDVYDNGVPVQDPTRLRLAAHHEIVITFGTAQEQPQIPAGYSFPEGL